MDKCKHDRKHLDPLGANAMLCLDCGAWWWLDYICDKPVAPADFARDDWEAVDSAIDTYINRDDYR